MQAFIIFAVSAFMTLVSVHVARTAAHPYEYILGIVSSVIWGALATLTTLAAIGIIA
jgi:hypothetical protein